MTDKIKVKTTTRDITYIAMSVALMTICAWITIPMTIPFTLQTFAVFAITGLFGYKRSIFAILIYIFLGSIGLPVFSSFKSGFGVLIGNTGGYLIGFIFTALIIGLIIKFFGSKSYIMFIAMVLGMLVCYIFGTAWFMYLYTKNTGTVGLYTVLTWCVFPFILPDLLKMALAIFIIKRFSKFVK